MQGTTDCSHEIAGPLLPQTDPVLDDATTLDTPGALLDRWIRIEQGWVGQVLLPCQLRAARFLAWHAALDQRQRERQEAPILPQPAASRSGRQGGLGHQRSMDTAAVGRMSKRIVRSALTSRIFL